MNIDKPLDELIKSDPSGRRGRGRGRGGSRTGGGADARKRSSASGRNAGAKAGAAANNSTKAQRQAAANATKPPVIIPGRGVGAATGSKIILSNLPLDVTDAQVRELFSSSIGPVKKIAMNYNMKGVSTGICTVEFVRSEDANRSYQQYNNRLIDGKKPLKVEVVVDPAKVPLKAPLKAPAALGAHAGPRAANGAGAKGGARGGATVRGTGRGGRGGRTPKPRKTVEDLDAEMEDYAKAGQNDSNAAAPAAAAAATSTAA
ncbi:hypothetical protein K437DRAFT_189667 [Tilletiaria anomala UBC 951]|uniref:RRM domain-containing protein n=1 Tax=Tilletiaria anomala (strain ATCC 24038 / CBS 436.72 / UBC 951) TaxID=1037660 RepID=A0A066VFE3_TILAU|nr:uncharacterized protein K437DRAFT_189667 [Tilletiaria anomala UBC 951]KDN40442.1 hypothetical protein K437DRAFT_189667 [Tilletiaria anomala UBC 951]